MEIILAKTNDLKKIMELGNNVNEFKVNDDTINFWPEKILKEIIKNGNIFILYSGENIYGFIIFNYNPIFKKAIIENIFISNEYRNKGYSKLLLEKTIERLKKIGCEYIITLVEEDSNANSFYKKNDFKKGKKFVWLDKKIGNLFNK